MPGLSFVAFAESSNSEREDVVMVNTNTTMKNAGLSLTYCTNIWSHYQASISNEFARQLGDDHFKLCLFEAVYEEQRKLGWINDVPDCKWIVGPPSTNDELKRLAQIVCDADVAVLGDCPQEVKMARVATGKLTFIMSERMFKEPLHLWWRLHPRFARGVIAFKKNIANRANVHHLPIGAYAAGDARRIGAYGERQWTWGYFAEVAREAPRPRISGQMRILWVGRLLGWKRVDLLLKAVAGVCLEPTFGGLDIVGSGPEKTELLKLAQNLGLGARCVFHEPVSPDRVRELMRQSDIYVLPSNRNEGWGVVANEAMSEGAVLVANRDAGAARMLVNHGRTGYMFKDGDVGDLTSILRMLLGDLSLCEKVRQAAWKELRRLWLPQVGAMRLIELYQGLLGLGSMPRYENGPCVPDKVW